MCIRDSNKGLEKDGTAKEGNLFHRPSEKLTGGFSPRELVSACKPVVIIDCVSVSYTHLLRIPDTLRDAAKEEAALRGMSFSAFVRTCMIEELAKKGA